MRESELARTFVASGLVGPKTVTQFVRALPPGDLGTSGGGRVIPPGLDATGGACALPESDPGCTLREATGSELAPCRACADFFFSSRRRHTRFDCDWSSDVCSSD